MLGSLHTLDIDGVVEVAEVGVGLADAVAVGAGGVLHVGHAPGAVAHELEGRGTFTLLFALETDIVVLHGFAPWAGDALGGGSVDTRLSALLLDEHVVETVGRDVVDVGIDGGITPVEEQARLGEAGERAVGIAVVHAVVLLLRLVPEGVIDEVAAALAVGPEVVGIPDELRCPHTADGAPVLIDIGTLGVAEDAWALAEVEGDALPVDGRRNATGRCRS